MRSLRLLLPTLLTALAVAGCSSSVDEASGPSGPKTATPAASAEGTTLRVGVQKDGIRSILEASGALEGLPYKIDWSIFQFGPPLVEAAGADKIDVAGVGSTPPLFGAAAPSSKFRVVAQIQYLSKQDDTLLAGKGSGIEDAQDLKGKKVAIPKGSSAHGLFLNYLDRNKIEESDVDIQYLAPADGLAAFSTGKVDAWAVWQPFVTQAETEGGKAIAGGAPDEDGFSFEIASTKAVQDGKRAAAIKDYMERLSVAFKWARTHQDEWAAAWSKESGLPIETTKKAVRERTQQIGPVTDEARASEQKLADTLFEHEVIPKKVTFDDIVTTGLAPGEAN